MGALSDFFLFGSKRRLWQCLTAGSAALVVVQVGSIVTSLPLEQARVSPLPSVPVLLLLPGSIAFGFGMVLAGGCPSRTLVRFASGHVGTAGTLASFGIAAVGTSLALGLLGSDRLGPTLPTFGASVVLGSSPLGSVAVLVGAAFLLTLTLRKVSARDRHVALMTAALGAAVGSAIVVSAAFLSGALPVNLVPGWAGTGNGGWTAAFQLTLLTGLVAGAACAAFANGAWRRATFRDRADVTRNLLGGSLMGVGGALIGGCTLAHAIGGVALFVPATFLALIGMALGVRWGLRFLETGRLLAFPHLAS